VNIEAINQVLQPVIQTMGYEFVGIEFLPGRIATLRIYIDRSEGIALEDCQKVSKQVGAVLDVEDVISWKYRLEVSSPGANRPLFTLQQFEHFVGEQVVLHLAQPIHEHNQLKGRINAVKDNVIEVLTQEGTVNIPFEQIQKAHLERQYAFGSND